MKIKVELLKKEVKILQSELSKFNIKRIRSKRMLVTLVSEFAFKGRRNFGIIGNLSENGLSMITAPTKPKRNFTPKTRLDVKFTLPSREIVNLYCEVVWSYKTPPYFLSNTIGMKIINPPLKYKEFLRNLK